MEVLRKGSGEGKGMYRCSEKILAVCKYSGCYFSGEVCSHLLTQCCDIAGSLDDTLATVMLGV